MQIFLVLHRNPLESDDIKRRRVHKQKRENGEERISPSLRILFSKWSSSLSFLKHFIKIHMRSIGYRSLDDGQMGPGIQTTF